MHGDCDTGIVANADSGWRMMAVRVRESSRFIFKKFNLPVLLRKSVNIIYSRQPDQIQQKYALLFTHYIRLASYSSV